jgi:hypothetical protein
VSRVERRQSALPPATPTTSRSRASRSIGENEKRLTEYEEDHLILLQLGGHPTDPKNLWPEPYRIKCGARIKDVLETKLKRMVCDGKMTLEAAQNAISTNWIAAYKKYVDKQGCLSVDEG